MGIISTIKLVRQSAVSVNPIVFGIKVAQLMQQFFILYLTSAFAAVEPFVIGGTV
jgi:hypothetical protein